MSFILFEYISMTDIYRISVYIREIVNMISFHVKVFFNYIIIIAVAEIERNLDKLRTLFFKLFISLT